MDIFSQGSSMRTDNAQHADGLTGASSECSYARARARG
jgi:hypothetical protein